MDANIADFIELHVNFLVGEASNYVSGAVHESDAVNALALGLHKFVAGVTHDTAAADMAEAKFRQRVAVLADAASASVH